MKKTIITASVSLVVLVLGGAIVAYGRGGHGGGHHGGGHAHRSHHGSHHSSHRDSHRAFGWHGDYGGRTWNTSVPIANRTFVNHLPERDLKPVVDRQHRQANAKDARNRFNKYSHNHHWNRHHWDRHHHWDHHWAHWHRWDRNYWRFNPNNNWWAWATVGALGGWIAAPVYYNYGDNVYYSGDGVYMGGKEIATAQQYAQQAEQLATSVPSSLSTDKLQWMPLGVFALTPEGTPSGDPTMYVQLAVTKEGYLGGTYFNENTQTSKAVQGSVDRKNQRAAWTYVGDKWPVMETGIYNLTQDEAPALVHFQDGQTQQWTLVRLKKPADDSQQAIPGTGTQFQLPAGK